MSERRANQVNQVSPYEYPPSVPGRRGSKPRTQAPKSQCNLCGSWGTWERSKWNLVEHQKRDICKKNRLLRPLNSPPYPVGRGNQVSPLPPSPGHVIRSTNTFQHLYEDQNQQIYVCRDTQEQVPTVDIGSVSTILSSADTVHTTQESGYLDGVDINTASQILSTPQIYSSLALLVPTLLKTDPSLSSSPQQLVHRDSFESLGTDNYGLNSGALSEIYFPNFLGPPLDSGNLVPGFESAPVIPVTIENQSSLVVESQDTPLSMRTSRKRRNNEEASSSHPDQDNIMDEMRKKLQDFERENKRLKFLNDMLQREMDKQRRQQLQQQADNFWGFFNNPFN